ncbi:MAG TPA: NAD-dependent DNA ligase LigA [Candidatus Paceibacterota bacterium]|nr:NAD-dependent DNA ligase LigA [Candidatus Paceibacterota bacterium]
MSKNDTKSLDSKKRIKQLEKIIVALDTAFEVGDDCTNPFTNEAVLDNEYDALKKELYTLYPESKIFTTVTASKAKSSKDKILHSPPMTSINKCSGSKEEKEDILSKFFKDCISNFKEEVIEDGKTFCMSYKIDGLALSINYKNGVLVDAGMRSKSGQDGINVTDKTKYIAGIPQKLPIPLTLTIRGEVETSISEFKKQCEILGDDAKANPRAHSSGSLNQKTAEKMKDRGLSFTAYNILNLENPPYKTEIERATWAEKNLGINFVKTIPFSYKMLETFETEHRRLRFLVDGVVISISDLKLQALMGNSGNKLTGNPKGKIAFKFADQIKNTIVKDINWQCGRAGSITPVLIISPVQLEGTQVSRCTAHNLGMIKSNKIGIGSEIEIIKSGKIIPKIHKVVKAQGSANIPINCPSCNFVLEEVEGSDGALSLVCNSDNCPAQNIKNLNHWFKILGVKGIAEKNIEKLIDAGLIQKPGDFYRLTVDGLTDVGITKRTAMLIVARIWMVRSPENIKDEDNLMDAIDGHNSVKIKTTMAKFFAAFGMKNAGKEAGRILEKEIGGWDEIKAATIDKLEAFDGIGGVMAQEIVRFFRDNKKMVEDVEQYFRFEVPKSGGKLDGKTFVLSGSLEKGKDYWKKEIETRGGTIKSGVSSKTNYLIAGSGSGLKSEKAESLNIPILTEEDLEKLLSN